MSKSKKDIKWYDSGNFITNLIIIVIALIVISSQSFAVNGDNTLALFSSVINHNTIYLLVLVYFFSLKINFGKKYFNYMNLFLLFIYIISTVTSCLTIFQSFSLNTVLDFITNFTIVIYFFHTMFRDTSYWKEYKLGNSPFNELTNEWYFYTIIVLGVFSLCVSLISAVEISGVVLSILDFIYIGLVGRYIFLYREYLDTKKININNKGNFDEIKENIKETLDNATEKVVNVIDEYHIDEKISNTIDKVSDATRDLKDELDKFVEENEIDKKIDDVKKSVNDTSKKVKAETTKFIKENKIDEKVDKVINDTTREFKNIKDKVVNEKSEISNKKESKVDNKATAKKKDNHPKNHYANKKSKKKNAGTKGDNE